MSDILNNNIEDSEEEIENYITLTDDNGEDISFEILDEIELNGRIFAVLIPFDDENGDVIILEIIPSDNSEDDEYISVEDEELLNAVFEEFKIRNADEIDFE